MAHRSIEQIQDFIRAFSSWASTQPDIQAVALVGSYAREAATESSDIDLVMLVNDPDRFIQDTDWLKQFGSIENNRLKIMGR